MIAPFLPKDEKDKKINILFHTEDVKIFKKDLREMGKPAKTVLPVGCLVSVDARRVHVVGAKNIEYQVRYCVHVVGAKNIEYQVRYRKR